MPGIEISALPTAAAAHLSDVLPTDQLPGPVTRQISLTQVLALFQADSVISATGTPNQVLINGTTGTPQQGALVFTLPQDIATTSSPMFDLLTLNTLLFEHDTNAANNTFPTVNLTAANKENQYVTYTTSGDGIQITMPDATTLQVGRTFVVTAINSPDASSCLVTTAGFTYFASIPAAANTSGSVTFTLLDNSTSEGIWEVDLGLGGLTGFPLSVPLGGTGFSSYTTGNILYASSSSTLATIGSLPGALTFGGMVSWANTGLSFFTASARQQPICASSAAGGGPTFQVYGMPFGQSANQLLYFNTAFQVLGLASANNGVLVTSGAGVPSISTTLPSGLAATNMNLTTPTLGVASATSINFGGAALATYSGLTAWTPVFTFATPGDLSVSYALQAGSYSRIGNLVTISFNVICTPTFTTSSGVLRITGLPFTSNAATGNYATGPLIASAITFTAGKTFAVLEVDPGVNYLTIYQTGSATATSQVTTANVVTGVAVTIAGSLTYMV